MAIAHNSTNTAAAATGGTVTISHTPAGSDRVLIAKIAYRATGSDLVTGVTFNTTEDFTKLRSDKNGQANTEMWYLVNPTATTANVVFTLSGPARHAASVSTYTGASQDTNPFASNNGANGTNDSPTVDLTGTTSGSMAIDSLAQISAGPDTATVGSGQTERANLAGTGVGTDTRHASSEEGSSGGTVTMSWSMSDADVWGLSAGELAEATSGVTVTPTAATMPLVAPSITVVLGLTISPTAGTMPLIAPAPTVVLGPLAITPDAGTMPLIAPAPTVGLVLTITPDAALMPLVAPSITVAGVPLIIAPAALAIPLVAQAPTILLGALTITPDAAPIPLVAPAPTVVLGPLTITPEAATIPLVAPAPTVGLALTISPTAATMALIGPSVTVSMGDMAVTPDAAAILLVLPSVTRLGGGLTPTPAIITMVAPAVTVFLGVTITMTVAPPGGSVLLVDYISS